MRNHHSPQDDRVRKAREARGLSQVELAAAAQLTRQSVGAIESGRVNPSVDVAIRLAQVLERSVEDLFAPEIAAPSVLAEAATSASTGRLSLAYIGGRWVAHGLRGHELRTAADGLSAQPPQRRQVRADFVRSPSDARDNVLLMGCAPGLGLLTDRLNSTRGAGRFVWLPCSSTEGLKALAQNQTHLAGVHLVDAKTGDENVTDVRRVVSGAQVILVTLARWEMGLVHVATCSKQVRSSADLGQSGLRIALREKGSGARRLLERELRARGVSVEGVLAHSVPARGHLDVAQMVATGAAETGVTSRDAAMAFNLEFVPLVEERYDLALRLESESDPRIQRMLNAMTSVGFRQELSSLGYDVRSCGDRAAVFAA